MININFQDLELLETLYYVLSDLAFYQFYLDVKFIKLSTILDLFVNGVLIIEELETKEDEDKVKQQFSIWFNTVESRELMNSINYYPIYDEDTLIGFELNA